MSDKKIFEEYKPVDCNDCDHYWNNTCDGVPEATERLCTSFKATRRVILPSRIEAVEQAVESLKTWLACAWIVLGSIAVMIVVFAR